MATLYSYPPLYVPSAFSNFGVRGPELGQVVDLLLDAPRPADPAVQQEDAAKPQPGKEEAEVLKKAQESSHDCLSSHVGCVYATQAGPG